MEQSTVTEMPNSTTDVTMDVANISSTLIPIVNSMGSIPAILLIFLTLQHVVFVLAFIGNTIVIIVFVKYLKLNTNINIICLNMAIADLVQGIGSGVQLLYFLYNWLNENKYFCMLRYTLISLPTTTSQILMTIATFDRFMAVKFPFKYSKYMTTKATWLTLISANIFSLAFNFAPFFGWNQWERGLPCNYTIIFTQSDLLASGLLIILCMITSTTLYSFVFVTALRYHRRVKKSENKNQNSTIKKSIRGARFLGVTTLVSTISWAPYEFSEVCNGLGFYGTVPSTVANFLVFFGIARCVTNPFIYMWHRKDFNMSVRRLLCCKESTYKENSKSTRQSSKGSERY